MSANNESLNPSPKDGDILNVNESDIKMIDVTDSTSRNSTRNVQTQHGDYRSVDEENTFVIAICLWPNKPEQSNSTATIQPIATTSNDTDETAEQVVWIEPFRDEVSLCHKLTA